jgi:hypothetical protein
VTGPRCLTGVTVAVLAVVAGVVAVRNRGPVSSEVEWRGRDHDLVRGGADVGALAANSWGLPRPERTGLGATDGSRGGAAGPPGTRWTHVSVRSPVPSREEEAAATQAALRLPRVGTVPAHGAPDVAGHARLAEDWSWALASDDPGVVGAAEAEIGLALSGEDGALARIALGVLARADDKVSLTQWVPSLFALLADADGGVRCASATVLGRLGLPDAALEAVCRRLPGEPLEQRWVAAGILVRLTRGDLSSPAVDHALASLLRDTAPEVVIATLQLLGGTALGVDAAAQLASMLRSEPVDRAVFIAVAGVRPKPHALVEELAVQATRPEPERALPALRALRSGVPEESARQVLATVSGVLASTSHERVRCSVLDTLVALDPARAVVCLRTVASDPSELDVVRERALVLLSLVDKR